MIDNALTRPWTIDKQYLCGSAQHPSWIEFYCAEAAAEVVIGEENYFMSGAGHLMPARKDQPPPDLRYFRKTQK